MTIIRTACLFVAMVGLVTGQAPITDRETATSFVEADGVVSFEAEHHSRRIGPWQLVEGRTPAAALLRVNRAGWHTLWLVKGAEPEAHSAGLPVTRRYPNWRVDKVVLFRDASREPAGDGPPEKETTRMKKLLSVVAGLVVAVPLMTEVASGQVGTGGAQKAEPAISKITDAYLAAIKARDAAKIAQLYTEDAVEMPPYQKPVKGRDAIRKYYEQQFKGEPVELSDLTLQRMDSRIAGDIGYDTGQYSQRVTPKAGKPMDDTGNYVVILHQTDGQWRVAFAIYNSHMMPLGTPATKKPQP